MISKFDKIYRQIILEEIVTKDLVNFRKKLYDDENYRLKCVQNLNNLKEDANDDIKHYINALIPWLQDQKQFKSPKAKTKIITFLRAIMKLQNGKPFLEKLINNQTVTKQDNKTESKNKENDQHENNQSDTELSSLALQLSQNVSDEYKKILIKYKNNKACKFLITSFNSDADSDNIQRGLTILNKSDKGKEIIKQLQQALQKYKKQLQS